jgi:BirA family transcriptional regulator, biotin operon repressor / biotin---[acetyl-CoA-carboxylase] ligase
MIGSPRAHFRVTDSTNERAKALAEAGAPHGTLVTAGEQTAGHGRQGRSWSAPPGGSILMSVLLRDLEERHALLPLAAAVAVCEAVAPLDCAIKWPNDVWIDRRKAAGILVEGRPQEGWAVVGIGLNVNVWPEDFPPELLQTATSVAIATGGERDPEPILQALLGRLDSLLAETDEEAILAAWRERDALFGERVSWRGGEGTAAGIDDSGALLVEADGEVLHLNAGEVHLAEVV